MARRSDCAHALMFRASAHIMPPPLGGGDIDSSSSSSSLHQQQQQGSSAAAGGGGRGGGSSDGGAGGDLGVGTVGEDVYIQQLQALINRYEQQSAAPFCAEAWSLGACRHSTKAGGGAGGGGRQQHGQDDGGMEGDGGAAAGEASAGVSYSLLLPAELRGLLW